MVPLPDKSRLIEDQDDDILLAMCLWGEARGEPTEGKIAVAHVVNNRRKRAGWFGANLRSVLLKPFQFSCFNRADPNRNKLLQPLVYDKPKVWEECYACALAVMNQLAPDPTKGATHYFAGRMPVWALEMAPLCEIGHHKFYKED